jgi:hypothetical protein
MGRARLRRWGQAEPGQEEEVEPYLVASSKNDMLTMFS